MLTYLMGTTNLQGEWIETSSRYHRKGYIIF